MRQSGWLPSLQTAPVGGKTVPQKGDQRQPTLDTFNAQIPNSQWSNFSTTKNSIFNNEQLEYFIKTIELAQENGQTLIGFLKETSYNLYS